jgi:alpha-glucosidase
MLRILVLFLLLFPSHAVAQDERRVASPDGKLEFRIRVAAQDISALSRLAYQIFYRGKPLIDTSYLGLNVRFQEPLLGENDGLTASKSSSGAGYTSLVAEYMQNGSLARRINVEVRVSNDGVAFRYVIPQSTPLVEFLLEDETTEFAFAQLGLARTSSQQLLALPLVVEQPGAGWVGIAEAGTGSFPHASLARYDDKIFVTRLAHRTNDPNIVYEGATPITLPWRVVLVGADRSNLLQSEFLKSLKP